jgi:hypothetical protein
VQKPNLTLITGGNFLGLGNCYKLSKRAVGVRSWQVIAIVSTEVMATTIAEWHDNEWDEAEITWEWKCERVYIPNIGF